MASPASRTIRPLRSTWSSRSPSAPRSAWRSASRWLLPESPGAGNYTGPMTPALIIAKKRDGLELSREEIADFVHGFTRGSIPEYQMAAFAMAAFLRGMTTDETAALTDAMLQSGVWLVWPHRQRSIVDKH